MAINNKKTKCYQKEQKNARTEKNINCPALYNVHGCIENNGNICSTVYERVAWLLIVSFKVIHSLINWFERRKKYISHSYKQDRGCATAEPQIKKGSNTIVRLDICFFSLSHALPSIFIIILFQFNEYGVWVWIFI